MSKHQRFHYVKLDECCYRCTEFIAVENMPAFGKACTALWFRLADMTKNSHGELIKNIGGQKMELTADDILRETGWGASETVSSITSYMNILIQGHLLYRNEDGFLAVTGLYFTGDHNEPVLHLSDNPAVQIYPVTVGDLRNENTRRSIQYRHDQRMIAEGKRPRIAPPKGMTYAELAEKLGIQKPAVSKLIRRYGYESSVIHIGAQKLIIPEDAAQQIIARYLDNRSGTGYGSSDAAGAQDRCRSGAESGNSTGNGVAINDGDAENRMDMLEMAGNGSGSSNAAERNSMEPVWKQSWNNCGNGDAERREIRGERKEAKTIYDKTPERFLSEKQNCTPLSDNDRSIIEMIRNYGFSDEVANVMLEYILRRSENRLIRSFVQSVCCEWARDGVDTYEKAIVETKKRIGRKREDVLPAYMTRSERKEDMPVSKEEIAEFQESIKEPNLGYSKN